MRPLEAVGMDLVPSRSRGACVSECARRAGTFGGSRRGRRQCVAEIRAHFPALQRIHNGAPVAYFDGPGGTQVPRAVVDAMSDYLLHHNANTHWAYPTSAETDAIIDDAREALADFLNARADEIVFGANMTTLTFHLAARSAAMWRRATR